MMNEDTLNPPVSEVLSTGVEGEPFTSRPFSNTTYIILLTISI